MDRFFGFGVHCCLRIFRFSAFSFGFRQNTNGFSDLECDVFFRFLFDLSAGNFAPPLIPSTSKTFVCPTCIGLIKDLTVLLAVFGFI